MATSSSCAECGKEDEAGVRVAGEAYDFARGDLDRTQPPADIQDAFDAEDLAASGPDDDVGGEKHADDGQDREPAGDPWMGLLCDGEARDDAGESGYGQRSYDVGHPLDGCLGQSHKRESGCFWRALPSGAVLGPASWGHVSAEG